MKIVPVYPYWSFYVAMTRTNKLILNDLIYINIKKKKKKKSDDIIDQFSILHIKCIDPGHLSSSCLCCTRA